MKRYITIFLLLLTPFVYSQKSTLFKNVNHRASELFHSLNETADTLILKGDHTIDKVEIFNDHFEKTYPINKKQVKIALNDIPVGRFITEVKVNDKLIIITLVRHEAFQEVTKVSGVNNELTTSFTQEITYQNNSEGKSPSEMVKFYWIVKHINKGHSSSKKMRIGDREVVDRMIAQHKIDLKTKAGKRNKLTIWEVYDTSKFMRFKRLHPDYAELKEADCFNTNPFYKSSGS